MPFFCTSCEADTAMCQLCARIGCTTKDCPGYVAMDWIAKIGNVCRRHDEHEVIRAFARRTRGGA